MPLSTIHGDANPGNLLVELDDPERVAGIVDFGDLVHTRTVIDPAIAAAYQAFGSDDPLDPLVDVLTAYHAVRPLTAAELELVPDLAAARMAQSLLISAWRAELHPDNVDYILADAEDCFATLARARRSTTRRRSPPRSRRHVACCDGHTRRSTRAWSCDARGSGRRSR